MILKFISPFSSSVSRESADISWYSNAYHRLDVQFLKNQLTFHDNEIHITV
jgi:hypothetical protein